MKKKKLILVLNCGSSSLKFSIINPDNEICYLSGIAECLYLNNSQIKWNCNNIQYQKLFLNPMSHENIFDFILKKIFITEKAIFSQVVAIGHRVVHGGIKLTSTTIINNKVINEIKKAIIFSPIHNPVNLMGIQLTLNTFPELSKKNVAVFDTAFYKNIPKKAYLYAIPYYLYHDYGIRRYGAHGISHQYVMYQTSVILNKKINQLNMISCHLGNGSSVSAIYKGICVDTSMGLTPLEGLVMGTRSGDIDPSIIFFMYKKLKISINEINTILTFKSGLLGLSNISSDFRDVESQYYINKKAKYAVDVFCYRLKKYISSYISLMNGVLDGIVFTGGIGENSPLVRKLSIDNLSLMGLISIDEEKNNNFKKQKNHFINTNGSIPILVIPTNEELAIAKKTKKCINVQSIQ
ncbi:Acetate kinase [Buchnera aphidicola (Eriosoma grossulariae)]|uniref:acetate kinase n=1 Tax=Buchnera aphidicola TaxID=9 RepID=UPI003463E8A9